MTQWVQRSAVLYPLVTPLAGRPLAGRRACVFQGAFEEDTRGRARARQWVQAHQNACVCASRTPLCVLAAAGQSAPTHPTQQVIAVWLQCQPAWDHRHHAAHIAHIVHTLRVLCSRWWPTPPPPPPPHPSSFAKVQLQWAPAVRHCGSWMPGAAEEHIPSRPPDDTKCQSTKPMGPFGTIPTVSPLGVRTQRAACRMTTWRSTPTGLPSHGRSSTASFFKSVSTLTCIHHWIKMD